MTPLKISRLPIIVVAASVALTAYSGGPSTQVGDVSGSPVQDQECSSCHMGGAYDPATVIEILDEAGVAQTTYVPGADYTLRVAVTAADEAGGYGFQAVVLDASDDQAGAFGEAPEATRIGNFARREYFEHTRRRTDSLAEVRWTAPLAGTGDVTVYAAGNAVDGNGNLSGDNVDLAALTLAEDTGTSSSRRELVGDWTATAVAPGRVRVDMPVGLTAGATVRATDLAGRTLAREAVDGNRVELQVGPGAGVVVVQLIDAEGRIATRRVGGM